MKFPKRFIGIIHLLLFNMLSFNTIAAPALPLIRSNSTTVDIKDGKTLIKGQWVLMSKKRPDIYRTINSNETKQVTFYTDVDSISFLTKPGDTHNFIILLNGKDSCFTQISTLKGTQIIHETKGAFMAPHIWIPLTILYALLVVCSILYWKRFQITMLLNLGTVIAGIFWVATIIGGFIHGEYNHFTEVVSEIGAIGTRSEIFMSATMMTITVLSIFFMIGLLRSAFLLTISIIPAMCTIAVPIMFFFAGLFPMGNPLHSASGPILLLIFTGTLLVLLLWPRDKKLYRIKWLSLISFILLSLITLRFLPSLQDHYPGLIQRFAHLGWSVWFVALNLEMKRLLQLKYEANAL